MRITRLTGAFRTLLPVVFCALLAASAAADYDRRWFTIDDGGTMLTTGGDFVLSGTIGQPDAGPASGAMTAGGFELSGGFWPGAQHPSVLGDCDSDGYVDPDDFAQFVTCMDGPDSGTTEGCGCTDLDNDGDVDLMDFATLQRLFTGQ